MTEFVYSELPLEMQLLIKQAIRGQDTLIIRDGVPVAKISGFEGLYFTLNYDSGKSIMPTWNRAEWNRLHQDFIESFGGVEPCQIRL